MGLDQYLNRKNYVKAWDHQKKAERFSVAVKKGGKAYKGIDPKKITYIIEEIGYWRKANAIHAWFVKNVQKGVDDCGDYYVSREMAQKLLDTCKIVLEGSKLVPGKVLNGYSYKDDKKVPIMEEGKIIQHEATAKLHLPTQEGFFFGSTDYDQYYYEDIKNTIKIMEEALKDEDGEIYYGSSW